jgi:hypothetical protein
MAESVSSSLLQMREPKMTWFLVGFNVVLSVRLLVEMVKNVRLRRELEILEEWYSRPYHYLPTHND